MILFAIIKLSKTVDITFYHPPIYAVELYIVKIRYKNIVEISLSAHPRHVIFSRKYFYSYENI